MLKETLQLHAKLDAQDVLISGHKVWCDLSCGVMRPLMPATMHRLVFNNVHSLAHPGICATRRMLTSRFVWTSCPTDVNTWCWECQQCASAKVQLHERAVVDAIPVSLHKFSHVHVDLVGPWPQTAEGHTHLLTVVDWTTKWAEAIPLQSTTAQMVADSFVANWVALFGVPATITSDQGTPGMRQCNCRALGSKPTTLSPMTW